MSFELAISIYLLSDSPDGYIVLGNPIGYPRSSRMASSLLSSIWAAAIFLGLQAAGASWPYNTYVTEPFQPPQLGVNVSGTPAPGYIFVGPRGEQPNGTAALIYDQDGSLVYQSPGAVTSNVNVQTLFGKPVLTYWDGDMLTIGFGYGLVHVLDDTYNEIYTVTLPGDIIPVDGSPRASYIDLHESQLTPRNTMLVTAYNVTQADLTSVGGAEDGWITDSTFWEIDVATNQVVFSWSALAHIDEIPLNYSHQPLPVGNDRNNPWDAYHINSVVAVDDGYLISIRHMFSAFYLNSDGSVKWRLSGNGGGDFQAGPNCNFSWQHHIRAFEETPTSITLSIFNNNNNGPSQRVPTTGLVLDLDLLFMTASNRRTLADASYPMYSWSQGSNQLVSGDPDGNALLDYGSTTVIHEFDSSGNTVLSAQFGEINQPASYRGYKYQWSATPFWDPAVVVRSNSAGNVSVYMSWNGATDYDTWSIYGGSSVAAANSTLLKTVARTGFETRADLVIGNLTYIQVAAEKGAGTRRYSMPVAVPS